jgi:hypothetical protein
MFISRPQGVQTHLEALVRHRSAPPRPQWTFPQVCYCTLAWAGAFTLELWQSRAWWVSEGLSGLETETWETHFSSGGGRDGEIHRSEPWLCPSHGPCDPGNGPHMEADQREAVRSRSGSPWRGCWCTYREDLGEAASQNSVRGRQCTERCGSGLTQTVMSEHRSRHCHRGRESECETSSQELPEPFNQVVQPEQT